VRQNTTGLPKGIIIWVLDGLLPVEVVFVVFLGVFERTKVILKLEAVFGASFYESIIVPGFRCWAGGLDTEDRKRKQIRLNEGAIMVKVIEEKIGYGGLGRGCL
jgi:hypothetical protein